MKLSEKDVQVLRNFSTINPSILFSEGDVLRTISPGKTMMAKAKMSSSVESTFAIYELSRFLGVISLFENPNFEIHENCVNISDSGRQVSYTFADQSTIVTPPSKDLPIDVDIEFTLDQAQYIEIMKAMSVMSLPEIVVAGENGKIILRATDTKNPSADKYDIDVNESTDMDFRVVFKSDNLKIIPSTYKVQISSKGISKFTSDDVEYWISIESTSTF